MPIIAQTKPDIRTQLDRKIVFKTRPDSTATELKKKKKNNVSWCAVEFADGRQLIFKSLFCTVQSTLKRNTWLVLKIN